MEKIDFENFEKLFLGKIFRRKNIFGENSKIILKSKIENQIFDFRFWDDFRNFPKKYFFDEHFQKVFKKKVFQNFQNRFSPWKINIFS